MTRLLPLLLLLFTFGCSNADFRPSATGEEGRILVITNPGLAEGPVGDALRETLGGEVLTLPTPEARYDLEFVDLSTYETLQNSIKKRKNILFVAPLDDSLLVSRFLEARLDSAVTALVQRGERALFPRPNLWVRNQMVVYVTAPDTPSLARQIRANAEDLEYLFDEITRRRTSVEMFEKERQVEMEARLMENHDFAINVQHDYIMARDTANAEWGFIRMRRILTDTWRDLFIYYIENANPGLLTPEWIYDTRDSLTQQWITTDRGNYVGMDRRRPVTTENINFLGRYGFETRGLWRVMGPQSATGGPFVNYTFYDQEQRRIYMIDGMVFAPNFDKREFLRQMEVIAHTFRTRQDETAIAAPAE